MNSDVFNILVAEDSESDTLLIKEAFKHISTPHLLHTVIDGEQAWDFICKTNGFEDAFSPSLVLLDINMPKKNGKEVLKLIKEDPSLLTTPVIIMTSSTSRVDIDESYNLHANGFLVKPI